jgi:hypothetical protein
LSGICGPDASAGRRAFVVPILLIIAVSFAVRCPALFVSSIDLDEGVYVVMAQQWLLGALPYVAVWDQHPPGLPALLAIVQVLIPDPVLGARLAATCAVAATALLIHRFCARHAHQPMAGLVGALLYVMCVSRWIGLPSNTEVFNNTCVTFAAYHLFAAARRPTGGAPRAMAAALVLGLGLQIKYVVFPEAALLCLGYLFIHYHRRRDWRAIMTMAGLLVLMGCLPTGIAMVYFWEQGSLRPFLDANVGSNVAYLEIVPSLATILQRTLSGMEPVVGPVLVIGYVLMRSVRWRREWLIAASPEAWISLWIVGAVANVCLPIKFFNHYYFALYPPLCIAGALALSEIAGRQRKILAIGIVALFLIPAPLALASVMRAVRIANADGPRAVAGFLQRAGARDMDVFVYDYNPVIYALAHTRPPTRYILGSELSQYSRSSRVDGVAIVEGVMDRHPRFVVVHAISPRDENPEALDVAIHNGLATYHAVYRVTDGVDQSEVTIYER